MFHIIYANIEGTECKVAHDNNTNNLFILITSVQHLKNSRLWYDSGLDYDNNRNFVDIHALQRNITHFKISTGTFLFFGIGYTSSFLGKVKYNR